MRTRVDNVCGHCGQELPEAPARVSIYGMYDCHLFHRIEGRTAEEIIANWRKHNSEPQPAYVGDVYVADLGKSALCPAIVVGGDGRDLRRVGRMVFDGGDPVSRDIALKAYADALNADPDIPRLLSAAPEQEQESP